MKYICYEVEVKSTIKNGSTITGKGIYEVESIHFEIDEPKIGQPIEKCRRIAKIRIYNKARTFTKIIEREHFSRIRLYTKIYDSWNKSYEICYIF
jgi:hypothetical protein